jgi:hypothetical protein
MKGERAMERTTFRNQEEIRYFLNTIMADPTHAYHNKSDLNHEFAVREVLRLNEMLYPDVEDHNKGKPWLP